MSTSVVIATYNRATLLSDCLESLSVQAYEPGDSVILVDNGSTDDTAGVVAEAQRRWWTVPLRYLKEPRPGKSHALNTALSVCNTDVVALTDDDVRVAPDWLLRIRQVMRDTGAELVGGRVLPLFQSRAPEWLELRGAGGFGRLASPLALLDYGSERQPLGPRTVLGANMAVSRVVFRALGGFAGSLGKLRGTLLSGEDHQLCEQVQARGGRALYDPTIVVHHVVPPERLTISYFVRWFFWSGVTHARMEAAKGARTPSLLGIPRHHLRQACASAAMAAASAAVANWPRVVVEATRTAFSIGYISASGSRTRPGSRRSLRGPAAEAA